MHSNPTMNNLMIKKLSNKQNKEIFELTKSGFGMTGIIVRAKLKIFLSNLPLKKAF